MINKARELIKEVKYIGNSKMGRLFEVGEERVRIFKKPGRTLITCTCINGTKFCNEPTICKHKLAVMFKLKDMKNEI